MKIHTVSGDFVTEINGAPGQDIQWHGRDSRGLTVKNGAYVVRVKSGGEVKSFPVMVVK